MSKQKGRTRRNFLRGKRRARKLKHVKGVDPALAEALSKGLGRDPTVGDAQKLQQEMLSQVLQRMVEMRLAQWLESVLETLRDEFGFTAEQLAQFARSFMDRTRNEKGE